MNNTKKALVEGAKEFGRVVLIAVLPILVDSLSTNSFSWRTTVVALVMAALKAIDKWVHENGNINANGIVPF
jgi:hypothetical protein